MSVGEFFPRRKFLALLCSFALAIMLAGPAYAKDGGGGGGGNSGSGSGSGSSGSDSGGSSGSGNGGSGGSNSESDGDGDGDDGDSSGKDKSDLDKDKIRDAVKSGDAISLVKAMKIVKAEQSARIVDVKLISKNNILSYKFRVISKAGKVKDIFMNAKTGRLRAKP